MNLKEAFAQSFDSLNRNRVRSGLTMLGIMWGLVTVVLLLSYGSRDELLDALLRIDGQLTGSVHAQAEDADLVALLATALSALPAAHRPTDCFSGSLVRC